MPKAKFTPENNPVLLFPPKSSQSALATLSYAAPRIVHLRDGEVVVYRRPESPLWQCRYKLQDGSWFRATTHQASLEHAVTAACLLYDEARFRQKLGLAQKGCNFTELAQTTLVELRASIGTSEKRGKSVNLSYISCIEKYFLPYFADRTLEELTHSDVIQFEAWRNRQMMKVPRASTLNNFAAAWTRLSQTAINRGWISQHAVIPKLSTKGQKSTPRPAFIAEEVEQLLAYMQSWIKEGRFSVEHETRPLLRDYVEMLLLTGMRHGTEAMGLCWNHCEWHWSKEQRYLRLWVDGKTGPRWLIAKHRAVEVLERLHARQKDIAAMSFDELLQSRTKQLVFRFSDGYQPPSLHGSFRRLMRDSGLLKTAGGQNRTLYSLRHTYATMELLAGTDIHTLARQMGTSVSMLERHYSKLVPTLKAAQLA